VPAGSTGLSIGGGPSDVPTRMNYFITTRPAVGVGCFHLTQPQIKKENFLLQSIVSYDPEVRNFLRFTLYLPLWQMIFIRVSLILIFLSVSQKFRD